MAQAGQSLRRLLPQGQPADSRVHHRASRPEADSESGTGAGCSAEHPGRQHHCDREDRHNRIAAVDLDGSGHMVSQAAGQRPGACLRVKLRNRLCRLEAVHGDGLLTVQDVTYYELVLSCNNIRYVVYFPYGESK